MGLKTGTCRNGIFDGWLTNVANGKDQLFHIHSASMNSSDQGNTYYDGTLVGTANVELEHMIVHMYPGGYNSEVGKQLTNSPKCEVAEFIAFDRVLSNTDRQAIEGYASPQVGLVRPTAQWTCQSGNSTGIGSGLAAEFTVSSPTQAYPIPLTITFKKSGSIMM